MKREHALAAAAVGAMFIPGVGPAVAAGLGKAGAAAGGLFGAGGAAGGAKAAGVAGKVAALKGGGAAAGGAGGLFSGGLSGSGAMMGMSLAGSGLTAFSQMRSAQIQSDELKAAAERAKLAAADDRIQRNESLLRSMAARKASSGSRGITMGSIAAPQAEDVRQTELGQMSADATLSGQVSSLRSRASNVQKAGKIAGGASLFKTLSSLQQIGTPGKGV